MYIGFVSYILLGTEEFFSNSFKDFCIWLSFGAQRHSEGKTEQGEGTVGQN
jgi:hypothetical protein